MLYDQGQLVTAYLEAYQLTNEEIYAKHAKTILDYLLRSMFNSDGGFFSAGESLRSFIGDRYIYIKYMY